MKLRPLPIRSLCCAPFASIPVVMLGGFSRSDTGIVYDFWGSLFFAVILGVPSSALCLLLIGLPLFLALRRFNKTFFLLSCVVGVLVPCCLFQGAPYGMILLTMAAALAVTLTAYLLRPTELKK